MIRSAGVGAIKAALKNDLAILGKRRGTMLSALRVGAVDP